MLTDQTLPSLVHLQYIIAEIIKQFAITNYTVPTPPPASIIVPCFETSLGCFGLQ